MQRALRGRGGRAGRARRKADSLAAGRPSFSTRPKCCSAASATVSSGRPRDSRATSNTSKPSQSSSCARRAARRAHGGAPRRPLDMPGARSLNTAASPCRALCSGACRAPALRSNRVRVASAHLLHLRRQRRLQQLVPGGSSAPQQAVRLRSPTLSSKRPPCAQDPPGRWLRRHEMPGNSWTVRALGWTRARSWGSTCGDCPKSCPCTSCASRPPGVQSTGVVRWRASTAARLCMITNSKGIA
jgi:hypothetical protein